MYNWEHFKTEYFVRAESECPIHGIHSLTGTGTTKSHIQPLIKDVVNDLPFYYDKCNLAEVKGIYTGLQKRYRRLNGNTYDYKTDPIEPAEKVNMTKKLVKEPLHA